MASALVCAVLAKNFQYEPQPGQLGPGFWPQLLYVGIFVCALARVAQKLRVRTEPVPAATKAEDVKWLGEIFVSEEPLYSPWNTDEYVLTGGRHGV